MLGAAGTVAALSPRGVVGANERVRLGFIGVGKRGLDKFKWFLDYSGGQITHMGVHYLSVIPWALGQEMLFARSLGGVARAV